jgi:YVTN family beta-propeller protein
VQVVLVYRIGESGLTGNLNMQQADPGAYSAAIPGQPVGTRISYQIQAQNSEGNTTFYPHQDEWLHFEIVELTGSPLAFTAIPDEDIISVLDTGNELELARIPVGDGPIQVLLTADGHKLYVSNLASSEIIVIETANFQILDRLEVAEQPLDMALSPDGRTIYVTNSGASSLTAIDVDSGTITTFLLNEMSRGPYGIAVAGADQTIYVTDLNNNRVIALDPAGRVLERITVGNQPRSLALSADGSKLFVTSFVGNSLTVIDVSRNQVSNSITLPVSGTFAVAPSPDGRKIYLTAHDEGLVVIVDAMSETFLKTLPIGTNPRAISFSPEGDQAFITSAASDEIFVINTATDEIVGTFLLGSGSRGIAITPSPDLPPSTVIELQPALPHTFALHPNFPNPFNASTHITYTVPGSGDTTLKIQLGIYDALGQKVHTLVRQNQNPGTYQIKWNGKDERGEDVASGVYVLLLDTPSERAVQKMLLLR